MQGELRPVRRQKAEGRRQKCRARFRWPTFSRKLAIVSSFLTSAFCLVPFALIKAAQSPSALAPTERALVTAIDADQPAAIALLERVVNINSGTQNLEGVRQVGAVFRAELEALGFRAEWVDGAAWQRAGHL